MKRFLSSVLTIRLIGLVYAAFATLKLLPFLTYTYYQLAYYGEADVLSAFTDAWQMPQISLALLVVSFLLGLALLSGAVALFFRSPVAIPFFLITVLMTIVNAALLAVSDIDIYREHLELGLAIVVALVDFLILTLPLLYARYLRSIGILQKDEAR